MIAGRLYRCADAELVAARIHARQVVRAYNATDPAAEHERRALLAGLFAQFGEGAVLEPPFHCDYGWNISLGDGAYVNVNCVILDCAPVTIGALSLIGPGVQLCAATHPVDPAQREAGHEYALADRPRQKRVDRSRCRCRGGRDGRREQRRGGRQRRHP